MLAAICSLALLATGELPASAAPPADSTFQATGSQWHATSANFVVRNFHASNDARRVAEHCERWRTKLQKYWIADQQDTWQMQCEIVVHANRSSYLAAVGTGGLQTFGSSLVKFGSEKEIVQRLIDFRGDSPHGLASVPHEMTHVVLADLLDGRQPPRWADEGMAILADSHEKQMLHERDLTHGLANRTAFRVAELVTMDSYPQSSRIAAFYGQSASLTACLAKRDDPAKFVEFLRRSLDNGYDKALRDVYHLDNLSELEQLWHGQRLAWSRGYHGIRLAIDDATAERTGRAE